MKNLDYISLIHKELTGELNAAEKQALQAWQNESNEHSSLAEQISDVWTMSENFSLDYDPNPTVGFSKFKQRIQAEAPTQQTKVIRMVPMAMRVAAAFVLLLGALFLFDMNLSGDNTHFAEADIDKVSLDDGTQVVLNQGSSLAVAESFNQSERRVILDGEAFFDVERNENAPFIITVDNAEVEVLGTAFNIESNESIMILDVQEGLVQFTQNGKSELVKAGEQLTWNKKTNQVSRSIVKSENNFSWINKELSFENTPMSQVFEDLGRYFNKEIKFSQKMNLECTFTSPTLKNVQLKDILDVIGATFTMEYKMVGSDVEISNFQCN